MKQLLAIFVLTPREQRLIIFVVLALVVGAWYKHHRDLNYSVPPEPAPSMSPTPQGAAVSKPPTNKKGGL
jgi:hypothetical protein